jgi:hypothetical protein
MRPKARTENLIVQELPGGVLVYDLARHRAHHLNRAAAAVWRRCDGATEVPEIAASVAVDLGLEGSVGLADAAVRLSIARLLRGGLIAASGDAPAPLLSRRELAQRLGKSAALAALPVVATLAVPTPAAATSCVNSGGSCSTSAQCCSNACSSNVCI